MPTIGILTLDSSNIKHKINLFVKYHRTELIKQFEDKLELLIGTSREFQGDERDIMYMTITASHSIVEKKIVLRLNHQEPQQPKNICESSMLLQVEQKENLLLFTASILMQLAL
ncbi:MAG: hypothetical protein IPJ53_17890 [Saprospiraceae bacterium]|nr:hypothetical protein [Candidatus Vicinibacter affinis]